METLLGVFEQLLDELASDIKEAPGWLFLIIACNVVLRADSVLRYVKDLGIEIGSEKGTIATLVAIVLFFLGDALDSVFFPREKDGKRWPKMLRGIMRALAAWGFFLAIQWNLWAVGVWTIFAALFPIHITLSRWGDESVNTEASTSRKVEYTGFAWLAPSSLDASRVDAERALGVHKHIYAVSKALVKAAKKYNCTWIQFENESAKFVRSVVFPGLLVTVALACQRQWLWAALVLLVSAALFVLYGRLKGRHMRCLYRLVVDDIVRDKASYHHFDLPNEERVFCWSGKVVASEKRLSLPNNPSGSQSHLI